MAAKFEFEPAYDYHPELGYFGPSRRMRRNLRVAAVAVVVGFAAGATAVVALRTRPDGSGIAQALSAAPAGADAVAALPAGNLRISVADPAPTKAVEPAGAEPVEAGPARTACAQQAWPYLDNDCLSAANRKRNARGLTPPAQPGPARVAGAEAATPKVAPAEQTKPPKITRKSARGRERAREVEWRDPRRRERWSEPSYGMVPYARYPRAPYASGPSGEAPPWAREGDRRGRLWDW